MEPFWIAFENSFSIAISQTFSSDVNKTKELPKHLSYAIKRKFCFQIQVFDGSHAYWSIWVMSKSKIVNLQFHKQFKNSPFWFVDQWYYEEAKFNFRMSTRNVFKRIDKSERREQVDCKQLNDIDEPEFSSDCWGSFQSLWFIVPGIYIII